MKSPAKILQPVWLSLLVCAFYLPPLLGQENLLSQETRITKTEGTVGSLLLHLEKAFDVHFSYNSTKFPLEKQVQLH